VRHLRLAGQAWLGCRPDDRDTHREHPPSQLVAVLIVVPIAVLIVASMALPRAFT
jgi:hypothetical protein